MREKRTEVEVRPHSMAVTENEHILYFKERDEERVFAIWGECAGRVSVTIGLSGSRTPRPLAADLLLDAITALDSSVEKVVIHDCQDNTYYSRIFLLRAGCEPVVLDSRPSDALAVRTGCPIYVEERLLADREPEKKPAEE